MNVLCVGDLHITLKTFKFIEALNDQLSTLILCEKYDAVILLGDVLDKFGMLEVDCAVKLIRNLSQLCQIYVLVGNHDFTTPHQFLSENHWMNPIKGLNNITIVDRPVRLGAAIFCPFVPEGRFIEALKTLGEDWLSAQVIFAHQGFKGARTSWGQLESADEWSSDLPTVISGHIHSMQTLDGVWYSGSVSEAKRSYLLSVQFGGDNLVVNAHVLGRAKSGVFTGTVEELLVAPNLQNSQITVQDTSENIRIFKTSEEYKVLCARNSVRFISQTLPFLDLYRRNILDTGDVYTYCAAEKILQGSEQDEKSHLFIKIK